VGNGTGVERPKTFLYFDCGQTKREEHMKKQWEELDVNEVIEAIKEHITNLNPELLQELYGLIADIDRLLQEKNSGS
jgi:hypothetical protein